MATANVLEGLMKRLRRDEWRDAFSEHMELHLAPACEDHGVSIEEMDEIIGDHHTASLWASVFEDFLTRELDEGRNIVDDYLKRRGWNESAANRTYIAALRSSVMSLYEISDIVLDESFLARDLVRGGEPVRVSEKSGTHYLKPWDRIAARLVRVGSRVEMAGGSLPFGIDPSEDLLEELRHTSKKAYAELRELGQEIEAPPAGAVMNTELLRHSAFLFTNVWLDDLLQRTLNPVLPQMINSDGDALAFTTVSYPLKPGASADAIRLALAAIPALRPEDETFWNWIGQESTGKPRRPKNQTFITTLDDGSVVLGNIQLKNGMLVLEANSSQRAERGRILIAPVLADFVGEPRIETQTVEQLMASKPAGQPKPMSSGLSPDEERAIIQENMDQHYKHLLDEPVPMLGDITPRRAAKSAKGREKLVTWLKLAENSAARHSDGSPMAGYDFTWMWEELGISELRR